MGTTVLFLDEQANLKELISVMFYRGESLFVILPLRKTQLQIKQTISLQQRTKFIWFCFELKRMKIQNRHTAVILWCVNLMLLWQSAITQAYVEPLPLLVGDAQTLTFKKCTAYYFEVSHKKLVIDLIHQENVDSILFTNDIIIAPCIGQNFHSNCTTSDSTYCSCES